MPRHVLAVDQGTTSSRAIVFDQAGSIAGLGQIEHQQILPRSGWVEHNPREIWDGVRKVIGAALKQANITSENLAAIGIANQRETTIVWNRHTGQPVCNAIVWQDVRTEPIVRRLAGAAGAGRYRSLVGLPLATYFSAPKIIWILENIPGAREAASRGELLFGTVDTWLLWNLTGGVDGGIHATDVTNASRTMLMDLDTLRWREDIAADMSIPLLMLPEIRSSSEAYGRGAPGTLISGVPISGILGDQQAAAFGQACFDRGEVKNTYGTGCFMLMNTGAQKAVSQHGLLTTVAWKLGEQPPTYALEGSIAVAGSLVQWLRDNLNLFHHASEVEELAGRVADNGGVYLVPAFSGLFAPHWRSDARGALVGLTRFANRSHIARAALEATAYQAREVLEAMEADSGIKLRELKVDGGMVGNELLMQFQADILNVDVVRPRVAETTALGAAYAAGIAVGFWEGEEVKDSWAEGRRWRPELDSPERERQYRNWKKAVARTLNWVDEESGF